MNLNHVAIFAAVAQHRGYSRAAQALGLDKGNVSRVVQTLERELGVVLLTRSSRRVALTVAGQAFLNGVAGPLAALEHARSQLVDRGFAPTGLVTLTTTADLARSLVAPIVVDFRRRYPAVRVRLLLGDAHVPVDASGADLALRVGTVGASRLKARKLGTVPAGFFASPVYLATRGTPTSLAELAQHEGLWPQRPRRRGFVSETEPPLPVIDCDDFATLATLASAGGGIAVLPLFLVARELAAGELVRVLPAQAFPGAPLSLVTGPERPLPPRVLALRDFLIERIVPQLTSDRGRISPR